ncbi:MAG: hypothetical protein ACRYGK_12070 [Janthinobacterium lividum]
MILEKPRQIRGGSGAGDSVTTSAATSTGATAKPRSTWQRETRRAPELACSALPGTACLEHGPALSW